MFATLRLPLITSLRWAISAVSGNDSSPTGVIFISLTPINFTLLQEEGEENIRNDLWHTEEEEEKRNRPRRHFAAAIDKLSWCDSIDLLHRQSGNSLVLGQDFKPFVLFFFFSHVKVDIKVAWMQSFQTQVIWRTAPVIVVVGGGRF